MKISELVFLALLFIPGRPFCIPAVPPQDDEGSGTSVEEPVSLPADAAAGTPLTLGSAIDASYDRGITLMYRLEFEEAEKEFAAVVAASSAHPAGYFAQCALSWWKLAQNFDVEDGTSSYEQEFMDRVDLTVAAAKGMLDRGEAPDQAYFFMGSAYGLKGRWYAVGRKWFKAYVYGKRGRKMLRKCVKLNPGLYDAYLGLGIFDYYADTLPGILSVPALLFVRGDRARGLAEVRLARDRGRFFGLEASLFLIEILTRHEKDAAGAVAEARRLRSADTSNPFLHLGEILALVHARSWEEVIAQCRLYLGAHANSANPWLAQQLSLVYLSAGDAWLALNRPAEAAELFTQGINSTRYAGKGWVTYCYLRRAQAYGLAGRADEAAADYRAVLARPNFWDSRHYASKGLKKTPDFPEVFRQITE